MGFWDRLLGRRTERLPLELADKTPPPGSRVEVGLERSTWYGESFFYPYNPDSMYQLKSGYDLYDEALRDDVVDSILEYKINLILGSNFTVESDDDTIRGFWDYALREGYEGSLQQAMRRMLSCLGYGFSLAEKVLKPVEYEGKTYWGIKFLKVRPPHGVLLHTDVHGNLEKIMQQGAEGGQEIELDPKDFILFTYRPRFENPYGQADISEGVYRAVKSKKLLIKFMNIALERFGAPLTVGTHPDEGRAGGGMLERFLELLKEITAKTVITKPKEYDIEFLESQHAPGTAHLEAIEFYNLSIARAMLISDLMGMSGKQMSGGGLGGGLGDVQYNVMLEINKRIRRELVALINHHLIFPLTRHNFGAEAYAELKIADLTEEQQHKAREMFLTYLEKGGTATPEQKRWFMEGIGAPTGEMDEEEEEPKEPEPPIPPQLPEPNEPAPEEPTEPEPQQPTEQEGQEQREQEIRAAEAPIPKVPPEAKISAAWDEKPAKAYRELTRPERRVNFAEVDRETRGLADKHYAEISKAVKEVQRRFYDYIRARNIVEKKKFPMLKQLKVVGLGKLGAVFTEMLNDSLEAGKRRAASELGVKLAAAGLEDIAAKEVVNEWKRSRVVWLTKNVSDEIIAQAEVILADAMMKGQGTAEVVRQLDKALESKLGKARLEMIARTNVMRAFNEGRLQATKEAPRVVGMQWSAILDSQTSDICERMDGKIFRPSEIGNYPIPAHPNCRSQWVAVFEEDTEGKNEREVFEPKPNVEQVGGFLKLVPGR